MFSKTITSQIQSRTSLVRQTTQPHQIHQMGLRMFSTNTNAVKKEVYANRLQLAMHLTGKPVTIEELYRTKPQLTEKEAGELLKGYREMKNSQDPLLDQITYKL